MGGNGEEVPAQFSDASAAYGTQLLLLHQFLSHWAQQYQQATKIKMNYLTLLLQVALVVVI